jgi:hypothetical protein
MNNKKYFAYSYRRFVVKSYFSLNSYNGFNPIFPKELNFLFCFSYVPSHKQIRKQNRNYKLKGYA